MNWKNIRRRWLLAVSVASFRTHATAPGRVIAWGGNANGQALAGLGKSQGEQYSMT